MSIRLVVAVTDSDWFEYLAARPYLAEVNFWSPGATPFKALGEGEATISCSKAARALVELHRRWRGILPRGHAALLPRVGGVRRGQWRGVPGADARKGGEVPARRAATTEAISPSAAASSPSRSSGRRRDGFPCRRIGRPTSSRSRPIRPRMKPGCGCGRRRMRRPRWDRSLAWPRTNLAGANRPSSSRAWARAPSASWSPTAIGGGAR